MTVTEYLGSFSACLQTVEATAPEGDVPLNVGMLRCLETLKHMRAVGGEVHLVGNGGSDGQVKHAFVDFVKAAVMRARIHDEATALTAYSNDDGYDVAWAKLLTLLMRSSDVLIAISTSGESANIINAVEAARKRWQSPVITFSGCEPTNRLRQLGDLNFYVPSDDYGHVELTHAALLHHITDEVAKA